MYRTDTGTPISASRFFVPAVLAAGITMGLVAGQAAPLVADALATTIDRAVQRPAAAQALGLADDYGTRHPRMAPALGPADDYGLRLGATVRLGPADDYGLRHSVR